jgi:predicted Zn-dependent protease
MFKLAVTLILSLLIGGCATSTSPGAVGISRPQLMMVASGGINAQSAAAYAKKTNESSAAGKLNSDPVEAARVKGIAQQLIQQTPAFRTDALSWSWEVNVIQSEELNAFCMPGGKIAVYSGMLTKLNLTDPELAALLGHEIAHALREHSREKQSQDVLAAAIVEGIAKSGSRYASTGALLTQVGAQLFVQLPYSREMEYESDTIGLELMARAGYDPSLAVGLWTKMAAYSGGGGATDFFRTHPGHEKRVENLQALVPRVLPLYQTASRSNPSSLAATPAGATAPMPANVATQDKPSGAIRTGQSAESARDDRPKKPALGPDSYQIERMLRDNPCSEAPVAELVEKGAGYEKYEVICRSGPPLRFRCEYGQCAATS